MKSLLILIALITAVAYGLRYAMVLHMAYSGVDITQNLSSFSVLHGYFSSALAPLLLAIIVGEWND